MKKSFWIILLLSNLILGQYANQLRGVWLTSTASTVLQSDQAIVEAVNYLSSIGINVIFPVVYNQGYTLYPSDVMFNHFGVKTVNNPAYSTRDFLERLIIEAHRVGIEVIPWFEYGFASSYNQNGGHIVATYPDWAAKNSSGQLLVKNYFDWLNGIHPQVQNFLISLVTEVIRKYDVDGVQGDDRLPSMPVEGGYDTYTVNLYKSENNNQNPPNDYNNTQWISWRANKLTQFMARLKDSVKKYGDYLILSSSPTPYPWGLNNYLQDSKAWVQQNLVDIIHPQIYRYNISDYTSALNQSITEIRNISPSKYYPGILIQSGTSYTCSTTLLNDMINLNRNNNINGEVHFFYEGFRANSNELGNFIYTNFYNQPALLPYRNGKLFRPKATIVHETDIQIKKYGSWSTSANSGFSGSTIKNTNNSVFSAVDYYLNVPFDAHFDVYAWIYASASENFNNVRYILYKQNGDSIITYINQADLSKHGWQKIGTLYLTKGLKKVFRVDNHGLISGKSIYADAGMIMINRKFSPNVVIEPSSQEENYSLKWQQAQASSNLPSWFSTNNNERGLAYLNNEVLIVSRTNGTFLKRINALDGSFINNMSTNGISGGTFLLNDVEVSDDGKIFACNTTTNSGNSSFKIYKWDNVSANPSVFLEYNQGNYRLGDLITVVGNTSTNAYIYCGAAGTNKILRWKISNGTLVSSTPTEITLSSSNINYPVAVAPVEATDNSNIFVSGSNLKPTLFSSNGTLLQQLNTNVNINFPGSLKYFTYANRNYLAIAHTNSSGFTGTTQNLVVLDVTNGLQNLGASDIVISTESLGNNSNVNTTGDVAIKVLTNSVEFYLLATNNGIAAFQSAKKPLPVEMGNININYQKGKIYINWNTITEINSQKFEIEKLFNNNWVKIGEVISFGNSYMTNYYQFIDNNVIPGKNIYRIKQIDFDGNFKYFDNIEINIEEKNFKILNAYPNPFNPSTNIIYYIPKEGKVTIKLYNLLGQEISTLFDNSQSSGLHTHSIDGANLSAGTYICNIQYNGISKSIKLLLIK